MTKFMYLFRHQQDRAKPASPEEMQRLMGLWMAWIGELKDAGNLVSPGERLNSVGKVVRGKTKTVTDGPYAETKDTIGGYMVVQAADFDQAIDLSRGCPIFDSDGSVEVRAIVSM